MVGLGISAPRLRRRAASSTCSSRRGLRTCRAQGAVLDTKKSQRSTAWRQERAKLEEHPIHSLVSDKLVTREYRTEDAFPAADVHVAAFYRGSIGTPVLRFDRIVALQVGKELEDKTDESCFVAFVADSKPTFSTPEATDSLPSYISAQLSDHAVQTSRDCADAAPAAPGALARSGNTGGGVVAAIARAVRRAQAAVLRAVLSVMKCEDAFSLWGMPYQERGIVGVIVYDTFGFHIPAENIGGRWRRRTNVGYISNMAVAPGCRRLGIASKLVQRCEALARADARIDAMALHVEPTNAPACKLYESLGYHAVRLGEKSPWSCLIGISDTGGPLQVMVKPLRDVELTDGSKRR